MNAYLITFDLINPGQNYDLIIEKIEGIGRFCKCLKNVWIVESTQTSLEVRNFLMQFLDENDLILVTNVTNNTAWSLHTENSNCLKNFFNV